MGNYRSLKSFGERIEYVVIGELLKRGFDVYKTLVDDQQIDCILRIEKNDNVKYIDVQIKARSKNCKPYDAARFAAMTILKPRENYYFIFYSEYLDKYWVIPSLELIKIASRNKKGKNIGKYHINLAGYSEKYNKVLYEGTIHEKKYEKYENAFYLLR